MRLSFPNLSRNFDESNGRVCFWGYDSTIEVTFFVEADALKLLYPDMGDAESGCLQAFDNAREKIHEVANSVYVRDGNGAYSYVLSSKNFN